jgi:hypothetical protein
MAASHEVDVEHRVIRSYMSGVFTDQELREHYELMRADPAFDPRFAQLCDIRAVSEMRLSAPVVRDVAQMSVFDPAAKRAVVVGDEAFHFGLARMFAITAETRGSQVRVFKDIDAAREWLGLQDE